MIRSMYSGISGMKGFQTKLDVVGNNIANVNTHGFKKGRVMFQDMVSQQVQGPMAATPNRGGVNSKQIGSGSMVGAIDTVHTGGGNQYTGRELDLAINGDGYFAVQIGDDTFYTRAGNIYFDNEGNVVNSSGAYLLGPDGNRLQIDPALLDDMESTTVNKQGEIIVSIQGQENPVTLQLGIANFANPEGLNSAGGSLFTATPASGPANLVIPGTQGTGDIQSGYLEMSNVDLADEFSEMIVAQRGFQANSRIITTSDEILQELVNLKR
ncbi:flagellar basal body rod protein FlgG [Shouchella clausii]|uniref:Flagellar hook protein FlgE n=4 Tax=Shouchella TaxID=2893057 RepID=Q5WFR4_SHOC1|nr:MULTISPECIES: flagellar basal body rod protein FlgG [Shouchella]MCM3312189.1 flagellar basal body rod protein FlgG [Psychrobacillus sp. MER TA 17]ALA54844.1 Flagellar basal-body rod protein FlgG [Shouchella clausii]KKI87833.1 flagellar basal body rod protein FlgG [Shouchella clausii]MBU3230826.1 flagellar basal body rod protein FlgG [Shouchella clausii]MBU3263099.1 flagellar basal body rod protein FlgG [Shouchella clausii]